MVIRAVQMDQLSDLEPVAREFDQEGTTGCLDDLICLTIAHSINLKRHRRRLGFLPVYIEGGGGVNFLFRYGDRGCWVVTR
jgi:hypothetical protein